MTYRSTRHEPAGFFLLICICMPGSAESWSAASSIAFEDVSTAVKCLQEALRLLTVEGAGVGKK